MTENNELLELAIGYAVEQHAGQTDKCGIPFILHPLTVMGMVETTDEKIVAVLHDAMEDAGITRDDLRDLGLSADHIIAIECITHIPNEPRVLYINRVLTNVLATTVKKADMRHNMTIERMDGIPYKDAKRMTLKYLQDWRQLSRLSYEEEF